MSCSFLRFQDSYNVIYHIYRINTNNQIQSGQVLAVKLTALDELMRSVNSTYGWPSKKLDTKSYFLCVCTEKKNRVFIFLIIGYISFEIYNRVTPLLRILWCGVGISFYSEIEIHVNEWIKLSSSFHIYQYLSRSRLKKVLRMWVFYTSKLLSSSFSKKKSCFLLLYQNSRRKTLRRYYRLFPLSHFHA